MSQFIFTLTLPDETGASRMALQFGRALVRRGHDVLITHGTIPVDDSGQPKKSILGAARESGIELFLEPRLSNPVDPALIKDLAKLAKQKKASAIIGVNQRDRSIAVRAAHSANVAGIVSAQNQHQFWGRWPLPWLKKRYYSRSMSRYADLIICTSTHVANEFANWFNVSEEKIVILQNAIDVQDFPTTSTETLQKLKDEFTEDGEFLWLNVGRIDKQKGQDILIEAVSQIVRTEPKIKVVLVGDVSAGGSRQIMAKYKSQLEEKVQELGLENQIVFASWRSDVPDLLRACDGYVHSARYEGSPLAVLESMAAQCAIVTVDNASRPNGFEHELHGLVAEPENATSLANQMLAMMKTSEEKRAQFGSNARQLGLSDYDIESVGNRFTDLVVEQSELIVSRKNRSVPS